MPRILQGYHLHEAWDLCCAIVGEIWDTAWEMAFGEELPEKHKERQ